MYARWPPGRPAEAPAVPEGDPGADEHLRTRACWSRSERLPGRRPRRRRAVKCPAPEVRSDLTPQGRYVVSAYLLGIDVGTQSSKGALLRVDGRVAAYHAVEHGVSRPLPGRAEHDAEAVWWGDVVLITRALLEQAGVDPADVAAVGVSALAPTMVPVDAHGRPLRPGILYGIDTRAHVEIERLNRELG